MLEIRGKHNAAIVYADTLESGAAGRLKALCDQEFVAGEKLRVMPDAHNGAGCVIGTTLTVSDKISPNIVGIDIGCGMEAVNIGRARMEFKKLDSVIRDRVPAGFNIRKQTHRFAELANLDRLTCAKALEMDKALKSVGTLGGGNHFIEIDLDEASGDYWLVVHSGSRGPGARVATWHQNLAGENRPENVPFELAWLKGDKFGDYVRDMNITLEFADINRRAIVDEILKGMKWKAKDSFSTIHNYLDAELMIVRKGAVSAKKGERLLIPLNMRDGALICEGLGNPDWNFSAPHGAGRSMSRKDAKNSLTLSQFKENMKGIYSPSINKETIDESPGAYKPMEAIIDKIGDTAKIITRIKPVYNFKAGGE
ncbi:MAG: RtcB family protein [Desulfovibrio sp.]|nr:RtcB family protein [Desulfovibrio sp.]